MIKYWVCYGIEKLHRYCFDVIYVQDRQAKASDQLPIRLLNLCARCVPDYRRYLRSTNKKEYLRYTNYENGKE